MPLRVAYFCLPSTYSLCFLNQCLRVHDLPIRAVIFSEVSGFDSGQPLSFWRVAVKTIRESGLRYACYELIFISGDALLKSWKILSVPPARRLLTFGELREQFNLTFYSSRDFNDSGTKTFLQEHDLNLGLSAFNNQIFKPSLIEWFENRRGIYNVHPALLPDFRGVEPIVPLLLNETSVAGVTLHSVNPQIDQGAIHYQKSFPLEPDDSVFSINHKAWHHGARLTKRLLDRLNAGTLSPGKDQANLPVQFGYAPFPSKQSIARLRSTGRRLIRLRHLRSLLRYPSTYPAEDS